MPESIEILLERAVTESCPFGEILICKANGSFILCHRADEGLSGLQIFRDPEDAVEIARYDDAGNYRPLKTAPNLRHGWQLEIIDAADLRLALDYFYPGRLAVFVAWTENRLVTTPLRETLQRQSGMYRIAAKISDDQINDLVGNFCCSDGGCLRTILWRRDERGTIPSTKLPPDKFEPLHKENRTPESPTPATAIPLLCQEACNLLVAECRKAVKMTANNDE
jgi:sirohydrochlorin cobaltochelatase